jgi:hypothetical protein
MSHVSAISDFLVTDLAVWSESCAAHGLEFRRDQKTFNWYKKWLDDWSSTRAASNQGFDPKTFGTCEHAVALKDATPADYEIGLVKHPEGKDGFAVVYDSFGPGKRIEEKVGVDLVALKAEYNERLALKHLRKRGFRVQRTLDSRGRVILTGVKR